MSKYGLTVNIESIVNQANEVIKSSDDLPMNYDVILAQLVDHLKTLKNVVDNNKESGETEDTQETLENFFKFWVFN